MHAFLLSAERKTNRQAKQTMCTPMETRIHLSQLTTGTHHYAFELDDAYFHGIEKAEIQGGTVVIEAELRLLPDDYRLTLRAKGNVTLVCDRCLGSMTYPIDIEDDIDPEDSDEANSESDELDIAWLAYEMLTTHLPLVHSHPEGACMDDMQQLLQAHLCSTVEDPNS